MGNALVKVFCVLCCCMIAGSVLLPYMTLSPEEMIVPWVLRGPGIKKGFTITEANNTVNTASTVVRLFGATQPLCWTGEVPESIFI